MFGEHPALFSAARAFPVLSCLLGSPPAAALDPLRGPRLWGPIVTGFGLCLVPTLLWALGPLMAARLDHSTPVPPHY